MTDIKLPPTPPEPDGYVPYAEGGQTNAGAYFDGYTACLATVKRLNNQPSIAASADTIPLTQATRDQVASVMLQTGTPEQQKEALAYAFSQRAASAEPVADATTKAAYIRAFGSEDGWLGEPGSWFIEGYHAAPVAAQPLTEPWDTGDADLDKVLDLVGQGGPCGSTAEAILRVKNRLAKPDAFNRNLAIALERQWTVLRGMREAEDRRPSTAATRDVALERRRQVEDFGFTPEKDATYVGGMLANAAQAYASNAVRTMRAHTTFGAPPSPWPWAPLWWKPSTPRRDLVKAAALILAEIERLDHIASKE